MNRNNESKRKNVFGVKFLGVVGILMIIFITSLITQKVMSYHNENQQSVDNEMNFIIGFRTSVSIESVYEAIYLSVEMGEIEPTEEQLNDLQIAKSNIDEMTLYKRKITSDAIKHFYDVANAISMKEHETITENSEEIDLQGFLMGKSFYYMFGAAQMCYLEGKITEDEFLKYKEEAFKVLETDSKEEIVNFLYYSEELVGGWIEKEETSSAKYEI